MENIEWQTVQEFYKEHFGTDLWLLEMMANRDILLLCASGSSNYTISTFLDVSTDEIELVIKEVFKFPGWELDLPMNPYSIFKSFVNENYEHKRTDIISAFCHELGKYSGFESIQSEEIFRICEIMENIEERIDNEWI